MRNFKIFVIVFTICMTILSAEIGAYAAGKQAYGDVYYGVTNHLNPIKDKAWTTITYNSDRPVSNRLYAEMWVQYQNGNNFYWEDPLTDLEYDAAKAEVVRWRYSLMAIKIRVEAKAAGCDDYVFEATAKP